jgi:hypothetical protein
LVAIVVLATALPSRGEEAISSRWEGTTHIPGDELTVIVDLAQENGAWIGSIIIPGLDVKGALLTDIKVKPPDVSFSVKGPLGIQLKLQLDGNGRMTGNFEQAGNRAATTLQRTGPPQVEQPQRNTPVAKETRRRVERRLRDGGLYPACVDQVYESRPKRRGGGVCDCRA